MILKYLQPRFMDADTTLQNPVTLQTAGTIPQLSSRKVSRRGRMLYTSLLMRPHCCYAHARFLSTRTRTCKNCTRTYYGLRVPVITEKNSRVSHLSQLSTVQTSLSQVRTSLHHQLVFLSAEQYTLLRIVPPIAYYLYENSSNAAPCN